MFACNSKYFYEDLKQILNITKVEANLEVGYDIPAGFSEGFVFEKYILSKSTINLFLMNNKKEFNYNPDSSWFKIGWV